jgi:2-keto-4-pentenoate hydratase/2-oxohepta-3-ene-1,7-dioic acid hydratase in catechol pathway
MKLIRYGAPEAEKSGVQLPDGRRIDVSAFTTDFDEHFFASGKIKELSAWVDANAATCAAIDPSERLGACIGRPSKLICIGLNYAKHAAESGMALPEEPVVFFKATTAICGPYDNLIIPKNSIKTDWEVELAVVIGKKASYVEEADAMEYVAG